MLRIIAITILMSAVTSVAACSDRQNSRGAPTQWEYSELGTTVNSGVLMSSYEYYYSGPEQRVVGADWKELAVKIGIKKQDSTRIEITNYLGSLGWEMLSYEHIINARLDGGIHSTEDCWIFKRPRH